MMFLVSFFCQPCSRKWKVDFLVRAVAFALLIATGAIPVSCFGQSEPRSQSLFEGQSLAGWEGDLRYWSVRDGTIVADIPEGQSLNKNTWLVWRDGTISDFELTLQFRLTGLPAANSGIQIRCQVDSIDHVSGYQADLDMGSTWLGRIYDEHGRALLVERGMHVHFAPDGTKRAAAFAPLHQYPVLYRENDWNDYRIVAIGERIDVYVNGTLFTSLWDQQEGQRDLTGQLALQLHSGPETHLAFRNLRLETLSPSDAERLSPWPESLEVAETSYEEAGIEPVGLDGQPLNMGFEKGSLEGWKVAGDAFRNQPVRDDGISKRWPGQTSRKVGDYFIGGFEIVQDAGTGWMESKPFHATHPYAGFMLGGGEAASTRVEILRWNEATKEDAVIATAVGNNQEQMKRIAVDLRNHRGATLSVRVVDENAGGWGHLNFDDFRLYEKPPAPLSPDTSRRSTFNAILHHLVPNPVPSEGPAAPSSARDTLQAMHVPQGFSVDAIAAEPDIHQPIAAAFDPRGRLWVLEAHSYPEKKPDGQGLDRIMILSDAEGDGTFESKKVFAEGLNLASGIELGYGGVWIGAAPQLLFIPDRDGDDRPDGPAEILLDGFGYGDTHETLNSFVWGPDGWLYGTQGVFNTSQIGPPSSAASDRTYLAAGVWRYHPIRRTFEVFAHGGSNPWGLDFDAHGQWFMTHCRSFWGRGGTTHVQQGGWYWNQVNSGYPEFISGTALPHHPHLQNFLLASARYDSGEGGAGKPGTGDIYGGHSHVGTMFYLGDNWPDAYRNHLLTHNLHGHQLNHQENRRVGGGYQTVHAGRDVLFCSDPQFVGVELLLGPDGAVYFTDWADPRHCHNPAAEAWDRSNGRIYRMKYDATYHPAHVDLSKASDSQLVDAQQHRNDWHARMARLVLASRYADRGLPTEVRARLEALAQQGPDEVLQLRALWTLQSTQSLRWPLLKALISDANEQVRAAAVSASQEASQLLAQDPAFAADFLAALNSLTDSESSLLVRRVLVSAWSNLPSDAAWSGLARMANQRQNADDRDLPVMLWQALGKHWPNDPTPAFAIADTTPLPVVRDSILWYAAKTSDAGRDAILQRIAGRDPELQSQDLELLTYALQGQRNVPPPASWSRTAPRLRQSSSPQVRSAAAWLGAFFGDESELQRQRETLVSSQQLPERLAAIELLGLRSSPKNLDPLLASLSTPELVAKSLQQLRRYEDPRIAPIVLKQLNGWSDDAQAAGIDLLSSRASWATQLLAAVRDGNLDRGRVRAFHARQIALLDDPDLHEQLVNTWGRIGEGNEKLKDEIRKNLEAYQGAPLWAFDAGNGQKHFQRLCASCHSLEKSNVEIAPNLRGTSAKGIAYAIENVIDPNAVIGRDYQARIVQTDDGQILAGLVVSESESAIQLRTANNTITLDRNDIENVRVSEASFMPQGLLESLDERQRIELFKFLMSL
ncbi:MAG: PVC-type heme-binding CxxCH protein [Pirellula sp.]